jgi:hypothetical protein
MIHLLTETSIFVSLPNGCLCQITGAPLIYLTSNSGTIQPPQAQKTIIKGPSVKRLSWEDADQQLRTKRQKVECLSTGAAVGWKMPTKAKLYVFSSVSLEFTWFILYI